MSDIQTIPLFPLPLVVCPTEELPLHIFEERYKTMIADCTASDVGFGVSLIYNNKFYPTGCLCNIEEIVKTYEDGQMDIQTFGYRRYNVRATYKDKPYMTGEVEFFDDPPEMPATGLRDKAVTLHIKLIEIIKGRTEISGYESVKQVSFQIAHNAGLDVFQKQKLIETRSENSRLKQLIEHFEKIIPDIEKAEEIKRRVNSNGHFKNLRSTDF
jgi:Lon protease-like protein